MHTATRRQVLRTAVVLDAHEELPVSPHARGEYCPQEDQGLLRGARPHTGDLPFADRGVGQVCLPHHVPHIHQVPAVGGKPVHSQCYDHHQHMHQHQPVGKVWSPAQTTTPHAYMNTDVYFIVCSHSFLFSSNL